MTILYAPGDYWTATPDQRKRICNGCGTKGLGGWLVPDTLWGINITAACDIHDWMYHQGTTILDKKAADRVFLNNMLRTIGGEGNSVLLKPVRRLRARSYYRFVRYFGGPAFWSGKNARHEERAAP